MSECLTYRYYLTIAGTTTQVYPVADDGLAKVTRRGDGEEYYRTTLEGDLVFMRDDYDLLSAADIEEEVTFLMEKRESDGTYTTYFSGYFHKTDIRFEENECGEGVATVTVSARDKYDKILAGLDKEFDLIELAPARTPVQFYRQPIFQVYQLGDSVLTCYLGGTYFELDVPSPPTANDLFTVHYFGYIGSHLVVYGDDLDPDVAGEYINEQSLDTIAGGTLSYIRKGDGAYRISLSGTTWQIVDTTTSTVMYETAAGAGVNEAEFTAVVSGDKCYSRGSTFFMRFITNEGTIFGGTTYDIPDPDLVSNPAGYTKVAGIGLTSADIPAGTPWEDVIIAHAGHSTAPTRYGTFSDDAPLYAGEYFTIPTGAGAGGIYPQAESQWTGIKSGFSEKQNASYWFQYDSTLRGFQESRAELVTLADAFKLSDALAVILAELDSTVIHEEGAAWSDFLYGSSNAIRGAVRYPLITPKSNITVGQYDQPAQKGPVKLSDILQLLWTVYRCKWHIDTEGRFIVEHIAYYENGGTYSGTNVSADLTTLIEPQTGKNWEHGANAWEYEKASMPERIEPGWMDRTTRPFDGYPIEIRSLFVQAGNIESQKAGRFTSDIDYMQFQPGDISKDGFAVLEAELSGGVYSVPYVTVNLPDGTGFKLQNGYLAFIYLHPNYHRYGLPAELVTINEGDNTALSVTRRKIQRIEYPLLSITDPIQLVTTGLGTGKVRELRENVNGQYVEAEIEHDTE